MGPQTPEISVNKLAEFVNASDNRKRNILKTIKSSNVEDISKRVRYSSAKSALRRFLVDEKHDHGIFNEKKKLLENKEILSTLKKNDRDNSLLALKHLEFCSNSILKPYLGYKSQSGLPKDQRSTKINGILIHLTPDIVFIDKKSEKVCGALKLAFTKSKPLTPHEGQIISGLIHKHLQKEFKVIIDINNCFVLDVFARRLFTAPESFNYYSIRLKKAFEEINTLWNKVA